MSAMRVAETGDGQLNDVEALIMLVLSGHAASAVLKDLRDLSQKHHPKCALGNLPACTCGRSEAENFLKLFDGKMKGKELFRRRRSR